MFGRSKNSAGANLAALFNNASATGGIENFANMLNNMGEQGGTKLGTLFSHLNSCGSKNYAEFLNVASPEESRAFSDWIERASDGELMGLANFLNKPPTSDSARLKQAIISFARLRIEQKQKPSYDSVKPAVISGRTEEVARYLHDGFDVNSRNGHGEVMLLHAVCMGDARLSITRLLIDHGADVNAVVHNKTILEFIRNPIYCDNERTIALLIERGARERTPALTDADMIRFHCPQCNKRLKASPSDRGKKATCNKCGTKMLVPSAAAAAVVTPLPRSNEMPDVAEQPWFNTPSSLDTADESDQPWVIDEPERIATQPAVPPPIPRKKSVPTASAPRRFRADIWLSIGFLVLLVLGGVGVYWWSGRPSSEQVAAYEAFLRTGNELVDMHQPITTEAQARAAEPKLMEKAQEHLECRKEVDRMSRSLSERKKKNLSERFERESSELKSKVFDLLESNKPLIVVIGASDQGEYHLLRMGTLGGSTTASATNIGGTTTTTIDPKPPAPSWKLESFAGMWQANKFSFDIKPDGRGRAEFENFSQGSGSFTISEAGKPVKLTADFQITSRDGKPVFSFELTASRGLVSKYEFEIIPGSSSDTLTVKELQGGRVDPNPAVMTRKAATNESTEVPDKNEGKRVVDGDSAKLQGKWKLTVVKWAEKDSTAMIYVTSTTYLIVEGDQMVIRDEDGGAIKETKYSFKLDSKKKPAVYERTVLDGKNKGHMSTGIYVIEGDTLKMCDKAKGLPTDFEITQGREVKDKYLFLYSRVK